MGVRLSTGDSIGPALRVRVTREREIVCTTMRERRERENGRGDRAKITGGGGIGCDGKRNGTTGRVANEVLLSFRGPITKLDCYYSSESK